MKLRDKNLIIIGVMCSIFLGLSSLEIIRSSWLNLSVTVISLSLLTIFLSYLLIIRRIEQLNHQIKEITAKNPITDRVTPNGKDEIFALAKQFNTILDEIQTTNHLFE